jgi:hypothetical protein
MGRKMDLMDDGEEDGIRPSEACRISVEHFREG